MDENMSEVVYFQPCAVCKYQRKRCDELCEFAPYFPLNRYHEFLNAQKLFGVSNIEKILRSVEPHQRQATAQTIILQGNARYHDPVYGCFGIIHNFLAQIAFYEEQLNIINQALRNFRQSEQQFKQKKEEDFSAGLVISASKNEWGLDLALASNPKIHGGGNYCQSTLEGGAHVESSGIQCINQMTESNEKEQSLRNNKEAEELRAICKAKGKQPMIYDSDEEAKSDIWTNQIREGIYDNGASIEEANDNMH